MISNQRMRLLNCCFTDFHAGFTWLKSLVMSNLIKASLRFIGCIPKLLIIQKATSTSSYRNLSEFVQEIKTNIEYEGGYNRIEEP